MLERMFTLTGKVTLANVDAGQARHDTPRQDAGQARHDNHLVDFLGVVDRVLRDLHRQVFLGHDRLARQA
jgi:hypothetical protein